MRKIITILALVLTVALCASFAASAATISGLSNTTTDANVTFNAKTEDKTAVYSVDVTWTDVAFIYNAGTTTWNPSTHEYDAAGAAASWTDGQGTVTVTNHSNAAVKATVSFEPASNGSATVTIANNVIALASAENTDKNDAPTGSATLTAGGAPTATGKIGTVKVTIAAGN